MKIETAREHLIYTMETLETLANNYYLEDGRDLIDRVEFDLESIEEQIQQCREALKDYAEALDESEDD